MRPLESWAVSTIAFDADDTLWHNETVFRLTEERFAALLADRFQEEDLKQRLLETEKKNLRFYGYGIKGFTLSMIETALELTGGRVSPQVIAEILAAGREMLTHPVETLPGVRETLEALSTSFRLILITKGDLFDQERKLAESGLGELFQAVEVVSEKTPEVYHRAFGRHGTGPEQGLMVGNSLRSDVLPALQAGCFAVHVPYQITWALERAPEPEECQRYRRLHHIGELLELSIVQEVYQSASGGKE